MASVSANSSRHPIDRQPVGAVEIRGGDDRFDDERLVDDISCKRTVSALIPGHRPEILEVRRVEITRQARQDEHHGEFRFRMLELELTAGLESGAVEGRQGFALMCGQAAERVTVTARF